LNKMKVGAIAITPPEFRASGGVSAALQLMERVAELTETRMMVMSTEEGTAKRGELIVDSVKASSVFGALNQYMPSKIKTLSWRADFDDWLARTKPEIVHLHNPHPPGALLSAARACLSRGIPYVISTHGFVEYNDYSKAYSAPIWQKLLINKLVREPLVEVVRQADRVFMLSPEERDIFLSMDVPENRLSIVSNGIDPIYLNPFSASELARITDKFNIPSGKPILFFVGNHTRNKGIDLVLKSWKEMKTDAFLIIGGGIRSAGEHNQMLIDAGLNTDEKDVIFTGFLDDDELKSLYETCDIFVFPSRADTLPLVVLEAMAAGKPVVSTRIGGIPYQVTPDTGVLVDSGDVSGLAQALDRLAQNAPLRQKMGLAGKSRAFELFNWERSAEQALLIYNSLLS